MRAEDDPEGDPFPTPPFKVPKFYFGDHIDPCALEEAIE